MSAASYGAVVLYCGHNATFIADIHRIGNVNVVRATGPLDKPGFLTRPAEKHSHHLMDFPCAGFWRPDLGVFVVPHNQVKEVKP